MASIRSALEQNNYQELTRLDPEALEHNTELELLLLQHPDPRFRAWAWREIGGIMDLAVTHVFQLMDVQLAADILNRAPEIFYLHFVTLSPGERDYGFVAEAAELTGKYPQLGPSLRDGIRLVRIALSNPTICEPVLERGIEWLNRQEPEDPDIGGMRQLLMDKLEDLVD